MRSGCILVKNESQVDPKILISRRTWIRKLNIAVIIFAAAAFVFAASGIQAAFGADTPAKIDKIGKTTNSAETKMMNKTDKAPKTKTMPNGADKAKVKAGATTKGDDASLKKGGKTPGGEK
ncbi:MAG: hypothetical protein ABFD50_22840 [Smithella sp.]